MLPEIPDSIRYDCESENRRQHISDQRQAEAAPHPAMNQLLQFILGFQVQVNGAVHDGKRDRQQADEDRIGPDQVKERARINARASTGIPTRAFPAATPNRKVAKKLAPKKE